VWDSGETVTNDQTISIDGRPDQMNLTSSLNHGIIINNDFFPVRNSQKCLDFSDLNEIVGEIVEAMGTSYVHGRLVNFE